MSLANELPDKDEERLVKKVFGLLKDGVKERERHDKAWDTYYAYAAAKHWDQDWTAMRSRPSVPLSAKVIHGTTPMIVDRNPTFEVLAVDSRHMDMGGVFHAGLQYVAYRQRYQRKLARNTVTSQITGTHLFEPVWDIDLDDQQGDIALREVMPWDCVAVGGDDVPNSEMVAIRRRLPLGRVKRYYRNRGDKVAPNLDPTQASHLPKLNFGFGTSTPTTFSSGGRTESYSTRSGSGASGDDEMAYIWEVYFRDEESYQVTQNMLEDGVLQEQVIEKLKYPGGWRCVVLSGNTILYDGKLPYAHLQVPLVKTTNYDIPGEFWGEGDMQNIVQLNKLVDVVMGQIIDTIRIGNDPPLLVPIGSGLNINNWANFPGMIAQYNSGGGKPEWMQPQRISPELFKMVEMCTGQIYDISGMSEISEGGVPFSGASGELVAQLREAAMTRIRLKVKNMEDGISQLGQQVVGLMQEFWTGHKMLRVSGLLPEEKLQSLPNIHLDNEGKAAFLPLNMNAVGEAGEEIKLNDISQGKYEVRVVSGSTLVKSHRQLLADTIALMQAGIYDKEDAAIVLDDPRKDAIVARAREEKAIAQQMMAAQAAQAQGPGGGSPPGPPVSPGMPGGAPPPLENPTMQPLPDDLSGAAERI